MRIGPLDVTLHRTVRVKDGREAANLPPSLGAMETHNVKDYRDRCPESWEDDAVFVGLHDTEALWLSFHPVGGQPLALNIGAGGINAVSGKPLSPKLEKDGYVVVPTQPWLDGWKSEDGTVYQFVATPYQKGDGLSVGEQILGQESKSGGLGIAVFEPIEPIVPQAGPKEWYSGGAYGAVPLEGALPPPAMAAAARFSRASFQEMGVGKGGKIIQKVYEDPYGLEVWKDEPVAVAAIYLVHAELLGEITGKPVPPPADQDSYHGPWFGLHDKDHKDVPGSSIFTGLKTVFSGIKSALTPDQPAKEEQQHTPIAPPASGQEN